MDGLGTGRSRVWGRVKWFDPTRGFGFVVAEDGGPDILLHINVLRGFGQTSVAEGARIQIEVQSSNRGAQAVSVVALEALDDHAAIDKIGQDEVLPGAEAGDFLPARVKWFDRAKGFGFANVFGAAEDVFLHSDVLRRSGLGEVMQGEAIAIRVVDGRRGKHAVEVRQWENSDT